jgi:hypothetical protein
VQVELFVIRENEVAERGESVGFEGLCGQWVVGGSSDVCWNDGFAATRRGGAHLCRLQRWR